jgi:hypothetical protein
MLTWRAKAYTQEEMPALRFAYSSSTCEYHIERIVAGALHNE